MNVIDRAIRSGLHDYEIIDIFINYAKANVKIILRTPQGESCNISINQLLFFSVEHEEPWGAGRYVCASDVIRNNNGACELNIELNSGDRIEVKYQNEK